MERAITAAAEGSDCVTLDIEVLVPACAPGSGTLEPNGLTPRKLYPPLRRLSSETNLVGTELVELNPFVDPTYATPLMANRCARKIPTGIATRKKGPTEEHSEGQSEQANVRAGVLGKGLPAT